MGVDARVRNIALTRHLLSVPNQQERLRSFRFELDVEPVLAKRACRLGGRKPLVEGWAVATASGGRPVDDDERPVRLEYACDLAQRLLARELVVVIVENVASRLSVSSGSSSTPLVTSSTFSGTPFSR